MIIVRQDVKFTEDKAYKRSKDFLLVDDQSEKLTDTSRVEHQDHGQQSTSIITSTRTGSSAGVPQSSQSMA